MILNSGLSLGPRSERPPPERVVRQRLSSRDYLYCCGTVASIVEKAPFDFENHGRSAANDYARQRGLYADFAETIKAILVDVVRRADIKCNSIDARAKTVESFARKAATPAEGHPDAPKYPEPLRQITDLSGVRVITFSPRAVSEVGQLIEQEFEIVEKVDHSAARLQAEQFGYQSVHYIVRLSPGRKRLPEYERYRDLVAEIQVRTVLQHAWAEIEHDIQYKSSSTIPTQIRRRFMALAGMLELADREFQAIQEDDTLLRQTARESLQRGELGEVEITPDAVHAYLDRRFGPDNRISSFSYEWTAKLLRQLGFVNFGQVEDAIKDYDDDQISRIVYGSRQGQTNRFEALLMAATGDQFINSHPWRETGWFPNFVQRALQRLREAGISVGSYAPPPAE